MKNLSIRLKITLWFSAVLIFVAALAFVAVFFVSDAVLQKGVRDNLVETVEDNVGEVRYFSSYQEMGDSGHVDLYLSYREGYLEIDDDFLNLVNGICTGLFQEDGTLLYGENPLGGVGTAAGFTEDVVQKLDVKGEVFYFYDRRLEREGQEGLWLRGMVSRRQGEVQLNAIVRFSLVVLPLLVALAALVGYLIARKALRPVQEIENAARRISQGKDLKGRIVLGPGGDELHRLAETFNGMLERLDSAFEAQQQFISDASHELRTPMSVILAQCEFTLEKEREAREYEKALKVIWRQGRKMSRLIAVLLDFSRLEQKARDFVMEKLDLAEVVESVCGDMALLKEKEISLAWEAQPGFIVRGNRELLSRLLVNLLSNAYRYGREQGHIWVRLSRKGNRAELSVEDNGIGIEPEQQEKIFRRFYQADASRTGQGNGLGLAMVKEIAAFHGGEIRVESRPGQGSTFILTLELESYAVHAPIA